LNRLASQTATYGLTSILGRLIGNLLLPLQTSRLSLRDFSILSEVLAYAAVLAVIFPLGLETALFRYSNDDLSKRKETEQKIISLQILVAAFLLPLSWFWLANRLPDLNQTDLVFIALTLAFDGVVSIFLARIRNENRSTSFLVVRLGSIFFTIVLNLLFLSGIPWLDAINPVGINYRLIIYINFTASFLTFLLMPRTLSQFRFFFDKQLYAKVLKFSIPIVMISIVGVSNDIFGRIWLENLTPKGFYGDLANKDLIGIYSGCAKVAIFINLGIQAYRYAADPFFFSIQDKKDTAKYLSQSFTWFVAAGLLALVAIQCNIELIVEIFLRKPEFKLGLNAIFLLLLANFFFGVYYNLSFWYKFSDKTYWGTMISVIGLSANAVLNFVLVPLYGMSGSAMALLMCYLLMCLISWYKSRSIFAVDWDYGKVFSILIFALFLCFVSQKFQPETFVFKIVWGLFLPTLLFVLVIWLQRSFLFKKSKNAGV
jgi:O-antigen/teichoic acid export membrane protein